LTTASGEMAFPLEEGPRDRSERGIDSVYRLVKAQTGLDLHLYRQGTVTRRLWSRIQQLRLRSHEEYADLLSTDAGEVSRLLSHVTIKVSSFLRNPELWALLEQQVLPELLRSGTAIRAWSAGGGRGEEAYSLAILLREVAETAVRPLAATIDCSDIDEEALEAARKGLYPPDVMDDVPQSLVQRYFTEEAGRFGPVYRVADHIRSMVRLHRQDLLAAAEGPEGGSHDLVLCRNVLIYLLKPSQERVVEVLTRSLRPGGYLCLGEAEYLARTERSSFETIDRRAGLYRKIGSVQRGGASSK
jgi:chemotaxis methyl-accepting protein methylase